MPNVVAVDEIDRPFDAILVAVKAYALAEVIDDIAGAVGSTTMLLPGLNGMAHIDQLRARFGDERVLGGAVLVSTTLDGEGRVVHFNASRGGLVYGEFSNRHSPASDELDATLQGAGFDAERSDDIEQAMWDKWVGLAALGATGCLMRATSGEIAAVPGGAEVSCAILDECVAVATAAGFTPSASVVKRSSEMLANPSLQRTTSLYRDLEDGRPVEGEQIIGDLVARARQFNVSVPLLALTATSLAIAQRRRDEVGC